MWLSSPLRPCAFRESSVSFDFCSFSDLTPPDRRFSELWSHKHEWAGTVNEIPRTRLPGITSHRDNSLCGRWGARHCAASSVTRLPLRCWRRLENGLWEESGYSQPDRQHATGCGFECRRVPRAPTIQFRRSARPFTPLTLPLPRVPGASQISERKWVNC